MVVVHEVAGGETKAQERGTQTFLIPADNKLELNEMISERHQSCSAAAWERGSQRHTS